MSDLDMTTADADTERERPLTVVVLDGPTALSAVEMDPWNASTLLAILSEDPRCWQDIADLWPRYRWEPAPEDLEHLSMRVSERSEALARLSGEEAPWFVIDLATARILTSPDHPPIERDVFITPDSEDADPAACLAVHLPPWWEVYQGAQPAEVDLPRQTELRRPDPRRDVLWGPPLAATLARLMLETCAAPEWNEERAASNPRRRYPFTVRVHRDWLMQPRPDLGDQTPRECLHGGIYWLDRVSDAQQRNASRGRPVPPIPNRMSAHAPMGRAEVCLYFDLCREMIESGWQWIVDHHSHDSQAGHRPDAHWLESRLSTVLGQIQERWMQAPFEDGPSPALTIQNERQRIPTVASPLEMTSGEHGDGCACPICDLMSTGMFGPMFLNFDGHHLELDNEFAFSLWETRDEWETEQTAFADLS